MRGRLNAAQRIAVLVALAPVLYLAGVYITANGHPVRTGGWFAYAPNTDPVFSDYDVMGPGASLGVWTALVAVWLGVALWLLASTPPAQPESN